LHGKRPLANTGGANEEKRAGQPPACDAPLEAGQDSVVSEYVLPTHSSQF